MRIEELMKTMFRAFFIITTGVTASMYVFCLLFAPEASFSLADIGRILLTAFFSDLTFLLFYSRKELGKKQMRIRFAVHLPVLLGLLLALARLWGWIHVGRPKEVLVYLMLVLGVYALVCLLSAYRDKKMAEKLNDGLKQRYRS